MVLELLYTLSHHMDLHALSVPLGDGGSEPFNIAIGEYTEYLEGLFEFIHGGPMQRVFLRRVRQPLGDGPSSVKLETTVEQCRRFALQQERAYSAFVVQSLR